jgi:hypothetical protein
MAPSRLRLLITAGFVVLLAATVVVFIAIDSDSHSVSDTLRPFILLMVPVWVIAVVLARRVMRGGTRG